MEDAQETLVEMLNSGHTGSVLDVLDIKLVEANKERVVGTMPIGPNQRQPFGYLHGGVSVVLAETLASIGSVLNIDQSQQMAFGMEINANHLRSRRDGILTGVATPLYRGRSTHVWEIKISDEEEKLVCISRCTIAVVNRSTAES